MWGENVLALVDMPTIMTRVFDDLPAFPKPKDLSHVQRLRITGCVEKPLELTVDEVLNLPPDRVSFDFACLEGWVVPNTDWVGVKVWTLLRLAGVLPEANYVVFKSGDFTECFSLADTHDMLVAYMHRGHRLTSEHGGPFRLVFPRQKCYQSIKWLEEIELTSSNVEGTACRTALAKIK
ncbi:MAG: molybdopterin-dependent oxidoreductase [Candidatus Caldarchaeum sp.]